MIRKAPSKEEGAEIVAKGKVVYDAGIRAHVETMENLEKILLLDVDTGEYAICHDERVDWLAKSGAMIEKNFAVRLFRLRIGYPTAARHAGGKWEPTIGGRPVVRHK